MSGRLLRPFSVRLEVDDEARPVVAAAAGRSPLEGAHEGVKVHHGVEAERLQPGLFKIPEKDPDHQ